MAKRPQKKARAESSISVPDEILSEDEVQLRDDSLKWHAPVYDHFKPAVIFRNAKGEKEYYKGELRYVFVCKRYALVFSFTMLVVLLISRGQQPSVREMYPIAHK